MGIVALGDSSWGAFGSGRCVLLAGICFTLGAKNGQTRCKVGQMCKSAPLSTLLGAPLAASCFAFSSLACCSLANLLPILNDLLC